MKKILLIMLFLILFSGIALAAEAPFHIGILTDTVSQGEDIYRGGERLVEEYGSIEDGGYISHLTFPDNFATEIETTMSQITGFADDPKMKAIIVFGGVPGTTESFRKVREMRPDILLLTGEIHEDPMMVADVADLIVSQNTLAKGYLRVQAAKKLGADTYMFISFPRHMSWEMLARQRDITRVAAEESGMKFIFQSSPDPLSDVGLAGAQQYILEQVPAWLEKYGMNTCFDAPNFGQAEPLIRQVVKLGGYIEGISPTLGWPGALGIEFDDSEKGDWPKILKKVEAKVLEEGGEGRVAVAAFSHFYTTGLVLGEHAKRVIEGTSELLSTDDILDAYKKYTPGAEWASTEYIDANEIKRKNYLLVYQDTYVFGKGFLHLTDEVIPEKYYDAAIGKGLTY